MMRMRMPSRCSQVARTRPVGPAPAIRTSSSASAILAINVLLLAAVCCHQHLSDSTHRFEEPHASNPLHHACGCVGCAGHCGNGCATCGTERATVARH